MTPTDPLLERLHGVRRKGVGWQPLRPSHPDRHPGLSIRESADQLGVSVTTAYCYSRPGELPGLVRLNGRYYVRRAVLEAWLDGVGELPSAATSDDLPEVRTRRAAGHPAAGEEA